jgi:hypothetical protein
MAKVHPQISPELKHWIERQPMYFLASAPLAAEGHINLSPRGLDSLRVTSENEVIILDLTGSGNETAAHLQQNGRLTVMFCAFEGEPRILRLFGTGSVILPGEDRWPGYRRLFAESIPGVRQVFKLAVSRVQTSCGFGVPLMQLESQRDLLTKWAVKKGEAKLTAYRQEKNAQSIDNLPAPGLSKST